MREISMTADVHFRTTRTLKRQLALLAADRDTDLSGFLRALAEDAVTRAIAAGQKAA